MNRLYLATLVGLLVTATSGDLSAKAFEKPLMRDFMGINGHLGFRSELYRPTCSLVRNYHPTVWDLTTDTSLHTTFPLSRQEIDGGLVNWSKVYGGWKASGFEIDACIQFDHLNPGEWQDLPRDAYAYGKAFASYFGPSHTNLVTAAEIGNEPVDYDLESYREVFEPMAKGLRAGDPDLKIVTTTIAAQQPDKYSKSVEIFAGLESLYDVLNIHTYSMIEGYPTWRRVHPEHPDIQYLRVIDEMIEWRDNHAKGKEIWVTEFGYDASTKPAPTTGTFSQWVSSTEREQAQWIVRSFLVFASMDVQRAYLYFYNDSDEAIFHGSSGLTRNYAPKPAYHAMAHLRKALGDFRFSRVITAEINSVYGFEFLSPDHPDEAIRVYWSPTGEQRETDYVIPMDGVEPIRAERMPLGEEPAEVTLFDSDASQIRITLSESPLYLWIQTRPSPDSP